jgi:hypothetical protein
MLQAKVVEKIKTHNLCSIPLTMWRMRIACCITKATDIHSEYVILAAFPLHQWLHELAPLLCYTYIAFLDYSLDEVFLLCGTN